MPSRVTATPEALEVIERLRAAHGPLALFQSAGCCDGSAPMCFRADELPPAPGDLRLGDLAGVPFYIGADQDVRWGHPELIVDVGPGAAESFSLEALEDVHFIARTPSPADQ